MSPTVRQLFWITGAVLASAACSSVGGEIIVMKAQVRTAGNSFLNSEPGTDQPTTDSTNYTTTNTTYTTNTTNTTTGATGDYSYVPDGIKPPAEHVVFDELFAFGTQNYRCKKNSSTSSWVNTANAQLFSPQMTDSNNETLGVSVNQKRPQGLHFFTAFSDVDAPLPTWKYGIGDTSDPDSGEVTTKKDIAIPDPEDPDENIPWVRLKPVSADIAPTVGKYAPTSFVLRVKTNGGVAPSLEQCTENGVVIRVPYEAIYLFYQKQGYY